MQSHGVVTVALSEKEREEDNDKVHLQKTSRTPHRHMARTLAHTAALSQLFLLTLPTCRKALHCCHGNTGYCAEQVHLYCIRMLCLCHHPGLSLLKCFNGLLCAACVCVCVLLICDRGNSLLKTETGILHS